MSKNRLEVCAIIIFLVAGPALRGDNGLIISRLHEYLVLYQGDVIYQPGHIVDQGNWIFRMDEAGRVTQAPRRVLGRYWLGAGDGDAGGGLAFAPAGAAHVNLWIPDPHGMLTRFLLNGATQIAGHKTTLLHTANPFWLQATNRSENNFLVLESTVSDDRYYLSAFGLYPTGGLDGHKWFLTSQSRGGNVCDDIEGCGGGVSADGRMMFYISGRAPRTTLLHVQPLTLAGRPTGASVLIRNVTPGGSVSGGIRAASVSGVNETGARIIGWTETLTKQYAVIPSRAYVQVIDGNTGHPRTSRVLVRSPLGLAGGQSIVVDPLGRFVLFVIRTSVTGQFDNSLIFQALDATGHCSGPARVLATHVHATVAIFLD